MPFEVDGWKVTKVLALIGIIALVKWYSRGATNTAERQLHSKVVIITVQFPIHRPHNGGVGFEYTY